MVERITITMKKDMLKRIDGLVDGSDIRNRSHAIESLLAKSLSKTGLDTVLILAGGTFNGAPKPLIPIHGRSVLEHQISLLKKYGITNVLLATDNSRKVREHFGDGSKLGVEITYIEDNGLGTAGPISLAKDYISSSFLLLNVDTLMNPNIHEMYDFHKKHKRLATVLLTTAADPSHYGVVTMRGTQIIKFTEKPRNSSSSLINAGLCIFDQAVVGMVPKRKMMIEELFRRLSKDEQLVGFVYDGSTFDTGTAKGYELALKEWKG